MLGSGGGHGCRVQLRADTHIEAPRILAVRRDAPLFAHVEIHAQAGFPFLAQGVNVLGLEVRAAADKFTAQGVGIGVVGDDGFVAVDGHGVHGATVQDWIAAL